MLFTIVLDLWGAELLLYDLSHKCLIQLLSTQQLLLGLERYVYNTYARTYIMTYSKLSWTNDFKTSALEFYILFLGLVCRHVCMCISVLDLHKNTTKNVSLRTSMPSGVASRMACSMVLVPGMVGHHLQLLVYSQVFAVHKARVELQLFLLSWLGMRLVYLKSHSNTSPNT